MKKNILYNSVEDIAIEMDNMLDSWLSSYSEIASYYSTPCSLEQTTIEYTAKIKMKDNDIFFFVVPEYIVIEFEHAGQKKRELQDIEFVDLKKIDTQDFLDTQWLQKNNLRKMIASIIYGGATNLDLNDFFLVFNIMKQRIKKMNDFFVEQKIQDIIQITNTDKTNNEIKKVLGSIVNDFNNFVVSKNKTDDTFVFTQQEQNALLCLFGEKVNINLSPALPNIIAVKENFKKWISDYLLSSKDANILLNTLLNEPFFEALVLNNEIYQKTPLNKVKSSLKI